MTVAIWAWVLAVYDRPGVPEATLALQDNHGQNTSFLLWAVYARATDRGLLDQAAAIARAWDQTALIPIRQARRALKTPLPPINDGARNARSASTNGRGKRSSNSSSSSAAEPLRCGRSEEEPIIFTEQEHIFF
jgi:uncharacterized protein (TIGR02444 family)